jgi:putative photosynthetic complex assembly protein 2
MLNIGLAVVAALMIWWVGTGAILYLVGLGRRAAARSMAGATVVLAGALYGIASLRDDTSIAAAYWQFACSVAVWAWLEMSFLLGYITGSRRQPCLAHCSGPRHFVHAVQAIIWHELAIIVLAAVVFALARGGSNQVALWTLLILWMMRESAKLNLFLGVRNLSEELLPPHLRYLRGFFRKRPMNFLFPISVTVSAVALTLQVQQILSPATTDFQAVSFTLLATMTALGLLEHWALVLPFSPNALWSWSLRAREAIR